MTAVEYLLEKYKSQNTLLFAEDWQQAKEMEKEQTVKAVDSVQIVCRKYLENGWTREDVLGKEVPTSEDKTYFGLSKTGEQYYNETFKSE